MAVALVGFYWIMAVSGQMDKSTTFDELPHLTAGYSYWLTDDYRLHPENGVLPQRLAALPLLSGGYRFPSLDLPAWRGSNFWTFGDQFFHHLGNPLDSMLLQGRAVIAGAGAVLGLVIYEWSRSLFGPAGGMLSLFLYVFCPSMLAHGGLITSDMMLCLTLTASVRCVWTMLHRVSAFTVLRSALVMALLFVSKMSAVLVVPMSLALLVVRKKFRRGEVEEAGAKPTPRTLAGIVAAHVLAVLIVIWALFGFRYSMFGPVQHPDDRAYFEWSVLLADSGPAGPMIQFARDFRLLPEAYLYGFASTLYSSRQRVAFLNGEHSRTGWWSFFPYAVLVKTPLALFVILSLAAAISLRRAQAGTILDGLYRTAPLWILLGVYWAVALGSNLNIGHRHILPTYPAMFILAGAAAGWFAPPRRMPAVMALAACLAWYAVESVSIRPHYLAYFNQAAGGPAHGYRHLVDSSLDWGQDLPGLKRWLKLQGLDEPSSAPVYLSYFGTGDPGYYGIAARPLPSFVERHLDVNPPLTGGVYCVSATMLQTLYLDFRGPWNGFYEVAYREALADVKLYHDTKGNQTARLKLEQDRGTAFWAGRFRQFAQLRFARLASYLRQREPDDHVGYSILIYRLSNEQVHDALYEPLAELLADDQS